MKKQMSNSIAFAKGVEVGIHEVENLYASIQKQRVIEGMIAAKKRGVRFGRPPKPRPKEFEQFKAAWLDGKLSSKKAAKMIGISQDTFLRWARDTSTQEMTVEEALQILGDFRKTLVSNPRNELSRTFYQKNKQQYYLLHYACCVCHLAV